jgi:O-antigen/teichoic acid export membrane protein
MIKIPGIIFPFKFSKSEFIRHSFILFLGLVFAQSLSVILYPVFSRIYTPGQFGTFALFVSITGIMALLSSGVYEQAILLPREEKKALTLIALPLILTMVQCSLFFVLILLFKDFIANKLLNNAQIKPFLLLIPVSVLLNNVYTTFTFYANRRKHYSFISQSAINQGVGINISKLVFGTSNLANSGLILGRIIGQFTSAVQLVTQVVRKSASLRHEINYSPDSLKEVAVAYKNFPMFRMPLALMNTFSTALPVFVLNKYFTAFDAGQYSLAAGVLLTPVVLIVSAVSKVLNQNIIERMNSGVPVYAYIKRVLRIIMPVTAVLFIAFFFFSKIIFVFLFGNDWQEAGKIGGMLLPWVFMVLFATPFGFVPDMFFRQKKAMIIDAVYLVLRIISMAAGVLVQNIFLSIGLFVITGFAVLAYNLIWYLSLLKDNDHRKLTVDLSSISREHDFNDQN